MTTTILILVLVVGLLALVLANRLEFRSVFRRRRGPPTRP
jgi:nucleoside recognition membrane protein YjiH